MRTPMSIAGNLPESSEKIRAAIVGSWRKRRTTPREGMKPDNPRAWEDPAPDWLWQTVEAILLRTRSEPDFGGAITMRAITWCTRGDPDARSAQLRELMALWLGNRVPMLDAFLTEAEKMNGGRVAPRKPFVLDGVSITHPTFTTDRAAPIEASIMIRGTTRAVRHVCNIINGMALPDSTPADG